MSEIHYTDAICVASYDAMIGFVTRCQEERSVHRSLTVVVLAHGSAKIAKEQLLPFLDYWHFRSRDFVDFVFPGYSGDPSVGKFKKRIPENAPRFSPSDFTEVVERFEASSTWRYGGEPSVFLLSAIRGTQPEALVSFDWSEVIDFDLARAISEKVIESPQTLFETIIRAAKSHSGDISQWSLSDMLGAGSLGSAILSALLENLPVKGVRRGVVVADLFQLRNRSPREERR